MNNGPWLAGKASYAASWTGRSLRSAAAKLPLVRASARTTTPKALCDRAQGWRRILPPTLVIWSFRSANQPQWGCVLFLNITQPRWG
jgi:hypothetical protein